jgi:hypothetical protein
LDDKSFRTIQIELTSDYTCKQFLNNYANSVKNSYLVENWRGQGNFYPKNQMISFT